MDKTLIIDGNSLAFRAYFALPFLTNSEGTPTGAVFGFMNMLLKVLDDLKPAHLVVAFDFARKTFRNQIFADYKGTRKETPDDLRQQFPIIKKLLKEMQINVVEKEGIEADDIIGTFAKSLPGKKVVLSGDRDLLQLIDPDTEVWLTHKGISEIHKTDERVLMLDYGLQPHQIIDLKGLMGDTSDNIPGISGIGPKTATNLIQSFASIENLYENLDSPPVTPKLREKLKNGRQNAFMSKLLATIKTDCDVSTNLSDCKLILPFSLDVTKIIKDLDMSSLLKRKDFFVDNEPELPMLKALKNQHICTLEQLNSICVHTPKQIAFNLGKDLSFSFGEEFWYTVESEITLFSQPPEISECLKVLEKFLCDKNVPKIFCDFKTQKRRLEKYNVCVLGDVFDIKIANYLLGNKDIDAENVGNYFSQKAILQKDIQKQKLQKVFYEMELPLTNVLYDMENAGFMVDKNVLESFAQEVTQSLKTHILNIIKLAGEDFNINSPKQLGIVLFDKLKLPHDNNPLRSTSVEVLTELLDMHPIVAEILKYRKLQKLKSTYIDVFLRKLNGKGSSGLIRTIFNQTEASTGRLSSSEPNLQTIPVRDGDGAKIRKAFISRFDQGQLVSADYNQIELRLLAHLSGDAVMISAFNSGQDIHTQTAMQMFGLSFSEVTPQIRRQAKAINFGIVYGISAVGLAQNAGISRHEASQYIQKYFEVYPTIKDYLEKNVVFATKKGYAQTLFGRRRKIPELKSDNHQTRQFGARVAKNMPMQGSASDIIKFAMLKVYDEIKKRGLQSKLILQIHDELIVDCPQEEVDEVKLILKTAMENVVSLSVKLEVSVESGVNYYEI